MNFQAYLQYFKAIIETEIAQLKPPYDNSEYINYTQLNWSRLNRWMKNGVLLPKTKQALQKINTPQNWLIITEPWCGDAAHIVPFIELMSRENELITTTYELRDSAPFSIENYLTNNAKSIPKIVIRNKSNEDIAVWGPRPANCQAIYNKLMEQKTTLENVKITLQKWYNNDKGVEIQQEILPLI